jgi:hypothetical protein
MAHLDDRSTVVIGSYRSIVDNMSHSREGIVDGSSPPIPGETMPEKTHPASEPDWLDPANDRKTPYTEAELNTLAADFIAMNRDVPAWRSLIAEVGEQEATAIAKQRLAGRDPLSLINWESAGAKH